MVPLTQPENEDREQGRRLLPLLLDLNSKLVVIFGGGRVGERKAKLFSDYARVRVVAQDFAPGLQEMEEDLELVAFDLYSGFERYLDGAFLVIPATSDSELNRAIEQEARRREILVNRVEGRGDVVVPSLIRKGPITIAISTESPGLSKYLRLRLEKELTENFQEMARLLGQMRRELKAMVPEQKDRSRIIWEILEDEVVWRLLDTSYEKAYMRARSHACQDERDSLDAGDPSQGSIDEIERAWHGDVETILKWVGSQDKVEECAVLKTCNRVEIYVVSPRGEKVLFDLAKKARVSSRIIDFHDHDESLLHLLRLASGLESMIIGEDQILGQMKELIQIAMKAGTTNWMLETAFKKAIQVGKRVRKETHINERSVSVGSAAVDLAEEILGDLKGKSVLVIGAGETGELISRALMAKDIASLCVTNRTLSSAEALADCLGGEAVHFQEMRSHLKTADVVISATAAPHYILLKEDIERAMIGREAPLLIIDIANPRDIDEAAAEVPGVELHNIDSLKSISSENMKQRMAEMAKVEAIIAEELQLLKAKYKRKQAEDLLALLYSQAEVIKDQEVRKAMNKLSARHTLGEIEQKVLQDMSHSIVNKLLSEPTKALKSAAERGDTELLQSLSELFRLEEKT